MTYSFFKKRRTYLDWASAAPVHGRAQKAFNTTLKLYGNPGSPHEEGRAAKAALEEARTRIARLSGVKQRAVVFTSGATEANALAIQGRVKKCLSEGNSYAQMHILYLPTMHSSVRNTLEKLKDSGVQVEEIPLEETAIDFDAFSKLIRPETILVCIDAVCGETGIRFDTLKASRNIEAAGYSKTAPLHVDASQLPLIDSIERTRLGASMLVLDAQKVGGVRGIGALIIPNPDLVEPIVHGGGQEIGLRPGTEPVVLAAAFAEALTICDERHEGFSNRARAVRALLIRDIKNSIPEAIFLEGKLQAPHILNLSLPNLDTDYLVTLLDTDGIAASTRSTCETDSTEGSKAVFAFTKDINRAKSTLRISWGPDTTHKDLQRLVPVLKEITTFLALS